MLAVVISEFVASNVTSFEDGYGSTPDWVELYNSGSDPVDLNGYHLTDNSGNPFKWRFDQSAVLQAQEYVVVFASGNDEVDPAGFFHTDFRLSAGGEYIGLYDAGGNLLSEFGSGGTDYPAQVTDISYGVGSDGSIGHLEFPTPLSGNSSSTTLGPNVESLTASGLAVNPGQSLVISASVTANTFPVNSTSVDIYYRHGFDEEVTLAANDDGIGGDAFAGDGIYSATVPNVGASGELLRWYITAEDSEGNFTRAPRFADPLNSAEYFGTVVTDASVDSNLPVLYWFVQNEAGAETDAGARGSLFVNGEFYDNIDTNIHGQSTRSDEFPKKSFDFDANSGDKFLIRDDLGRVSDFNLLTNYADQTKIRQPLAYDIYDAAGHPGSVLGFSVSVYRNGEFYGLFDLIEEGEEEFLEREGLDTNGALYKVDNPLNSAYNNVDKETRQYEGNDDLQLVFDELAAATTTSAKLDLIYDHLDVATLVNYVAVNSLIGNADYGHKNMYWYRDTEGTGQWQLLPWDQDLSFGHYFFGSHFDNRSFSTISEDIVFHELFELVFVDPDLSDMLYRRLRTLTEQLFGPSGSSGEDSYAGQKAREFEALNADEAAADLALWGLHANFAGSFPFNPAQAVDQLVNDYIPNRREFLLGNARTPPAQTGNPAVVFDALEFDADPVSGLQSEEFIRLNNPTSSAVDLSGWRLSGSIDHTLLAGTVIPAGGTLYVVKDVQAFQARSVGPSGGQKLVIQGNYDGQLSSTGGTVYLEAVDGTVVDTLTTSSQEVRDIQEHLVVSEVNYNPAGTANSEFIEFFNNSSATTPVTLDLAGVSIVEGPSTPFVFPAGTTLAAGEYLVVVQDAAGFAAAYPSVSSSAVAGVYTGQLSDSGDTIRVDGTDGGTILEFAYDDSAPWSPLADGAGRSLELIDPFSSVDSLDSYFSWRASPEVGGTPGAEATAILGDANRDGVFNFADIPAFIAVLQSGVYIEEADVNGDGVVDFSDISHFVDELRLQ